jgi:hypothetical protein
MDDTQNHRLFDVTKVTSHQFEPVEQLRQAAKDYTKSTLGSDWSDEGLDTMQVDHERGHATFLAYRDAMNNPAGSETPGLRDSYAAMAEHVNRQYEHITKPVAEGGLGITHSVHETEPYGFHWAGGSDTDAATEMANDLRTNRHIKTLATASTGPHEFFDNETNDRFRAVHDVFGHGATGRGFSRHGEEAAFHAHRQMFPPEAHAALATETRGQNSYLNYGPGGFASQEGRLVGLPDWAERSGPLPAPAPRPRIRQGVQQQLDLGI